MLFNIYLIGKFARGGVRIAKGGIGDKIKGRPRSAPTGGGGTQVGGGGKQGDGG